MNGLGHTVIVVVEGDFLAPSKPLVSLKALFSLFLKRIFFLLAGALREELNKSLCKQLRTAQHQIAWVALIGCCEHVTYTWVAWVDTRRPMPLYDILSASTTISRVAAGLGFPILQE